MEIYEAAITYKGWIHWVELKDVFQLSDLISAIQIWGEVDRKEISDDLIIFYFKKKPIARVVYKEK